MPECACPHSLGAALAQNEHPLASRTQMLADVALSATVLGVYLLVGITEDRSVFVDPDTQ